eukprot:scaffold6095_cov92-Isochrysis_galbana.AAC.6
MASVPSAAVGDETHQLVFGKGGWRVRRGASPPLQIPPPTGILPTARARIAPTGIILLVARAEWYA